MRRPVRAALAPLALAALLAGCAPHLVSPYELPTPVLLARFSAFDRARRPAASTVDAELAVWVETESTGRLPGVQARLALAGPDAARLRVASMFGTALDIGARGDTLAAYVPARRVGLQLDAVGDSLGVSGAGAFAFRAWSGLWQPPAAAWARVVREDTLRVVRWAEGADSVTLALTSAGVPAWAEAGRDGRVAARVRYEEWASLDGVTWPALLEIGDPEGRFTLTARTHRVRTVRAADRARVAVPIPADAERWTLADLRRALERLGAP